MNCPKCGRPVSERQNICPRCHEKLYHGGEQNESNETNTGAQETVAVDIKPKKKSVFKEILLILIIIVLIFVLMVVFKNTIIGFCEDISWLNWLVNLLESVPIDGIF